MGRCHRRRTEGSYGGVGITNWQRGYPEYLGTPRTWVLLRI